MTAAAGPLNGYRIVEITQMIAGPVSATLLADMGADVIKVEPVDGESTRHGPGVIPLETPNFVMLNQGKRDIAIDLRAADGRAALHRIIAGADAVIIGYRPDVCRQFELTWEELSAINPRLIYLQNTAFGSEGPLAGLGGYDLIVQGMSGLLALNAALQADGQPRQIVPAIADYTTACIIAWAITAALLHRERTGDGQRIETSLLSSALTAQLARVRLFEAIDGEQQQKFRDRLRALREANEPWSAQLALKAETAPAHGAIYYRAYATSDGYLLVACLNNPTRVKFLEVTGIVDPRMLDGRLDLSDTQSDEYRRRTVAIVAEVERVMRTRASRAWLADFAAAQVPAGPLRFTEEIFDDEQVRANGYIQEVEHPLLGRYYTAAPPVRMERSPLAHRTSAPLLGEHSRQVLHEAGIERDVIESLIARGVVVARGPQEANA